MAITFPTRTSRAAAERLLAAKELASEDGHTCLGCDCDTFECECDDHLANISMLALEPDTRW